MNRSKKGAFHGANLGNWLVLEHWMSPHIFGGTDAEDEVWLNRPESWKDFDSREELDRRMKQHRDTYVTEEDFAYLSAHGIDHVRIPVPFFIFGDRPPYAGCIEYLDRAFDWAEAHDMTILIDLHTVPGSQNGYDNGGITGVCKWCKDPQAVAFTYTVLERLAQRYADRKGLFGIEVLNEPINFLTYMTAPSTGKSRDREEAKGSGPVPTSFLKTFYKEAYRRIRKYLPVDKAVVFHDGFRMTAWKDFFVKSGMENVYLDVHIYIFAMENIAHIHKPWLYRAYIAADRLRLKMVQRYTPVIVGEWCLCAAYAFDTPKAGLTDAQWQEERRRRYNEIAEIELSVWEETAGWYYWNYQLRKDLSDMPDQRWKDPWDLRRCIEERWLPDLRGGRA
ncbi:MAG: cellulase family glycosylhydrolase [Lachnospiraceae bacterium]|nr:cellulase family glycosylhydrolase [Lachnospiraceae bacterium]